MFVANHAIAKPCHGVSRNGRVFVMKMS
jgi:hypothetical protein